MAPEARECPPLPRVRRLLLDGLEPRRHAHRRLPVGLPAREFLPVPIEHDERGHGARARRVLDPHARRRRALQVRQRLRPEGRVARRARAGVIVRAVVVGRWAGRCGACAEADAGEVPVARFRAGFSAEHGEPVYGAVFVAVEAESGEWVQGFGVGGGVERAEEAVFAAVQPGGCGGEVVADQGGEFEILVSRPETDFGELGRGEETVVGVAADEIGLFADGETVVADLLIC